MELAIAHEPLVLILSSSASGVPNANISFIVSENKKYILAITMANMLSQIHVH